MKIEDYSFGSITIDSDVYKNDVIILPEKVVPEWWRKEGHNLYLEDLQFLNEFTPNALVVGCGYFGVMKISPEVRHYCTKHRINLIAEKSGKAVKLFNEISDNPGVVGAFHLTC